MGSAPPTKTQRSTLDKKDGNFIVYSFNSVTMKYVLIVKLRIFVSYDFFLLFVHSAHTFRFGEIP